MVPTTSRQKRKELLNSLSPDSFKSYRDFFFALHLNSNTQHMHFLGALIGVVLFIFAIAYLSPLLFLIYFLFFYGFGFLSHLIFDGQISRTAKEAPWKSFVYAVELNWHCLTGEIKNIEQNLLIKYPFLKSIYIDEHES